jgi:hypothetical protein
MKPVPTNLILGPARKAFYDTMYKLISELPPTSHNPQHLPTAPVIPTSRDSPG